MAEQAKTLADYLGALRRRWKLAGAVGAGVLVLGIVVAFALPSVYRSRAIILIETQEVPAALVQTTVTTYAAQQIEVISQRVMTTANLSKIIEKFDMYQDERRQMPMWAVAQLMGQGVRRDLITSEVVDPRKGLPQQLVVAFSIAFEHGDPELAQKVANEMTTLYLDENVRARTEQTAETTAFLSDEVARLEAEIGEMEKQLAVFKEENKDTLPELSMMNMRMVDRIDDQLLDITRQLNSIEEQRIFIDAQLAQLEPTAPMMLPSGQAVVSPEDQLKALQTQLVMLEGRYSDSHPDVIKTRRDIEAIRERYGFMADLTETNASLTKARSELAMAQERYSPDHPDVLRLKREVERLETQASQLDRGYMDNIEVDNPAWVQLNAQREALAADELALEKKQAELEQKLVDYEARITQAPQVERELSSLMRRLNSASNQYWVIRDKMMEAELGQSLEQGLKGERFSLIEPAAVPIRPAKPNRPAILALTLILSLVAAFLAVQLAEALDTSLRGARALMQVQGSPPIAEIPMIRTIADIEHGRRLRQRAMIGVSAALVVAVVVVHVAVMPLDVLWYSTLQRLGQ